MSLILNIDTATEKAGVCLSRDGVSLFELQHEDQKNHAAFVQPAIQEVMLATGYTLQQLDAIAVTAGPGSYTGLRVGLATAKGLCFTLDKPLIMINTLEVMAKAASEISDLGSRISDLRATMSNQQSEITDPESEIRDPRSEILFCPLIDARRMEVFTALYNANLEEVMPPAAMIITEESFATWLDQQPVLFSGSGHRKLQDILQHQNALFSTVEHRPSDLGALAALAFRENRLADLAYSEPFYLKEFFTPALKA
jgi:tRNA threonylcarbamoyladenosine biosynthesis protein TsaB